MLGPVELVDEIDSTNAELLRRAGAGAPAGAVLVARHQTAGRGRLDRRWEAPPGASLLVSVLLRPGVPATESFLFTMAAGLAAIEACAAVAGVGAWLKWPNDAVVERPEGTRKLAGILAEAQLDGDRLAVLVVGMGLNVDWQNPLPDELAGIATALNHETGSEVDRDRLLEVWLRAFGDRLDRLGPATVAEYRGACSTLGRRVRVERPGDVVEGQAVDVDDHGRLVVAAGGTTHLVAVGDVVHLRPG